MFMPSRAGRLFVMDENEDGDDAPSSSVSERTPVRGLILTRQFNMATMTPKRFQRVMADVVLPVGSQLRITAIARNPDTEDVLVPELSNTSAEDEDYSLKLPIRRKAYALSAQIESVTGRPEIRAMSVEAAISGMPPSGETRNVA